MRIKRWFWFLIFIAFGAAIGVAYGWYIQPAKFQDVSLRSLRADYQADYVLMVAESYAREKDLNRAEVSLKQLHSADPADIIRKALDTGRELGYGETDLQLLDQLLNVFEPHSSFYKNGKTGYE